MSFIIHALKQNLVYLKHTTSLIVSIKFYRKFNSKWYTEKIITKYIQIKVVFCIT